MKKINWENKNEVREYKRRKQKIYADKHRGYYRQKNREINHILKQREYATKHKEYYHLKMKEHNLKNNLNGKHRKFQKEYAQNNPEKIKAHTLVHINNLKGNECEKCNSIIDLEAHHSDYSKPMEIVTLCRIHHNEIHRK